MRIDRRTRWLFTLDDRNSNDIGIDWRYTVHVYDLNGSAGSCGDKEKEIHWKLKKRTTPSMKSHTNCITIEMELMKNTSLHTDAHWWEIGEQENSWRPFASYDEKDTIRVEIVPFFFGQPWVHLLKIQWNDRKWTEVFVSVSVVVFIKDLDDYSNLSYETNHNELNHSVTAVSWWSVDRTGIKRKTTEGTSIILLSLEVESVWSETKTECTHRQPCMVPVSNTMEKCDVYKTWWYTVLDMSETSRSRALTPSQMQSCYRPL